MIDQTAAASPPQPAASNARPREIEEPLNWYFIHPMSRALVTLLIPTGITPNMVSALGVVMAAFAAGAYAGLAWPWNAFVGLGFHIAWHVFDGADGQLARATGKTSTYGEIVDGVCDHLSHLVLYVVVALLLTPSLGAWAWALTAAALASRALQAISYETTRRNYRRWVYSLNWIRQDLDKAATAAKPGPLGAFGVALAGVYLKLSELVRADDRAIDAAMARLTREGGAKAEGARSLYREAELPMVHRAAWLSTNYETTAMALSFLAGSPIWFVGFELTVLNLVLAASVIGQARSYARLLPRLEALETA